MFFAPGIGMVPFVMHQFRETCAGVLSLGWEERCGAVRRTGGGGANS